MDYYYLSEQVKSVHNHKAGTALGEATTRDWDNIVIINWDGTRKSIL